LAITETPQINLRKTIKNILILIIIMSLEQNIQQWVTIDNQLKLLNERVRELRERKNALSENIYSNVNDTNNTIVIPDGQIKVVSVKETQQLTFKHLETCLSEIIKNEEQVKKIVEYVKNKRETKLVKDIKRTYN
jgi:hypothetical protein